MNLLLLLVITVPPPVTYEEREAAADEQLARARTLPDARQKHVVSEIAGKGRLAGRTFIGQALPEDRWIIPQLGPLLHQDDFHDFALLVLWRTFPRDAPAVTIPHLQHADKNCPSRKEMALKLSRTGFGEQPAVARYLAEMCEPLRRGGAWGCIPECRTPSFQRQRERSVNWRPA